MNSPNSILLEGNLVKDPDYQVTAKGVPVCNFSIASNRFYKKDDEYKKEVSFLLYSSSFFDITTWGKLADACGKYLKKGRGVRIVGKLKQGRWKNTDGGSKSRVYVVADHVEFKPNYKEEMNDNSKNNVG
jgi:single-strand DNA-binding protein